MIYFAYVASAAVNSRPLKLRVQFFFFVCELASAKGLTKAPCRSLIMLASPPAFSLCSCSIIFSVAFKNVYGFSSFARFARYFSNYAREAYQLILIMPATIGSSVTALRFNINYFYCVQFPPLSNTLRRCSSHANWAVLRRKSHWAHCVSLFAITSSSQQFCLAKLFCVNRVFHHIAALDINETNFSSFLSRKSFKTSKNLFSFSALCLSNSLIWTE